MHIRLSDFQPDNLSDVPPILPHFHRTYTLVLELVSQSKWRSQLQWNIHSLSHKWPQVSEGKVLILLRRAWFGSLQWNGRNDLTRGKFSSLCSWKVRLATHFLHLKEGPGHLELLKGTWQTHLSSPLCPLSCYAINQTAFVLSSRPR